MSFLRVSSRLLLFETTILAPSTIVNPFPYPQQPPAEEPEEVEDDAPDLDIRLPDPDETGAVEEEQKSADAPPPQREGKTPAELAAEMLKKGRRRS